MATLAARVTPILRPARQPLLGALLVGHGLGHAVLPLRGGYAFEPPTSVLAFLLYTTAMLGFVGAGLGLLGARPFRNGVAPAAVVASFASLIALCLMPASDLWPGVMLSIVIGLYAARTNPAAGPPPHTVAHAIGDAVALLLFAYLSVSTVTFPWHRSWGVTETERVAAMPGDRPVRMPQLEIMHGVTIAAPPERVWPWLVQIGQDRAGFYSYDWLERLFFDDIRNADEVKVEWQRRRVGDFVRAAQPGYLGGVLGTELGWYVTEIQPGRALVLHQWGAFVLQPDGRGGTRLLVRSTISDPRMPVWAAAMSFAAFELPHFIMERRMLLGIKERAERTGA
jgi:hypothetical protein